MSRKLAATGFAGAMLAAVAVIPSAADEHFIPYQAVQLPDAGVLGAFDISFVDPASRTLAVAVSRAVDSRGPFGTVVIVNTDDNVVTKELISDPPFAGACSFPGRNTVGGPNGVIVIKNGTEVWAGDGPVLTTQGKANICSNTTAPPNPVTGDIASPSTVKVLDPKSGATIANISTGGNGRADELCYNPKSHVVLIANDETFDNFITFIDANFYQVIQKINFNGKDPTGNNILANGLEQCIWNPKDGLFYMNIPNTVQGSNTTAPGVTLVISGTAPFKIEKVFDFSKAPLNTTGCTGGAGIALGPDNQLALSCGLIINDQTGSPIAAFPTEGGADEMWFNPSDNHYFFADSGTTPPQLGVVDAGPPPSGDLVAVIGTGSHSVAADSVTNEVYVPIRGNNAVTPAGTAAVCSKATDAFGLAGSDALGCILSYIAPTDSDDDPPAKHKRHARR
jgi:DNA-binding beta-propeller fold protein YncE